MKVKWAIMIVAGVFVVISVLLSFNPNVRGAVKLALSNSSIVTLTSEDDTMTVMTKMNQGQGFQEVITHLEADGWVLSDQLGSAFYFTKGEEGLMVMLKMWTNHYIVAEMTEG